MRESTVARVYAEALFQLATERGRRPALDEELRGLRQVFASHREIRNFFASPGTPRELKLQLLESTLAPQLDPVTVGWLRLVVRKGREMFIERILEAYERLADEAEGRIAVSVTSARPLGDDLTQRLVNEIANGHKVELRAQVDRRLLGGLTIRVGDRLLDNSLRTRLRRLRDQALHGR